MRTTWSVVGAVVLGCAFGCSAEDGRSDNAPQAESDDALTAASLIQGSAFFLGEFPGVQGNGRACATCHVPRLHFALTPAFVEGRYRALQAAKQHDPHADDPLFRAIDADDGHEDFTSLRKHALVHVRVTLPENSNVWLAGHPEQRTVTVLRSVPTAQNVKFTAPYQSDRSQPTLQLQALGALKAHAEIKHDPRPEHLDAVADFESLLFSSFFAAIQLDPPLNATERAGKTIFDKACGFCHGGRTQTEPRPGVPQNILVSRPLPPPAQGIEGFTHSDYLPVQMWALRQPDGSVKQMPSTDPGRALVTGDPADFNQFDTPQLRGIRDTAPYFHDNSAENMDQVLDHYVALFKFLRVVGAPNIPEFSRDDYEPLKAYLNKL